MARLEIKRKLTARSDRVKAVDIHPTEPWLLSSLFSGQVHVWNYQTQTLVKTFEVTELPVRTAKFVARKQWVITGSDDMYIRVFNYNTMKKVKVVEAHTDYLRSLAVHPSQPYVLSSSDDMTIKLWDWDKNWHNLMVFEGHSHYVMMIVFNPKDPNTFASASLDRTVKVWGLNSSNPYFTLEGHDKGVNCVDYMVDGDKPYLVSGADDRLVKVWDYQNKTCVATLEGHTNNVSAVCFHPELPFIISGSEDGSLRIWNSSTYRSEKVLNYTMERIWSLGHLRGSHCLAAGYDQGAVLLKFGREEPSYSMDSTGKIAWAKHNEIVSVNIKNAAEDSTPDGERLTLATKDLGTTEVYPRYLRHSPNGRFIAVCGDGEFIIYTALAWRNKSFGTGQEFVWDSTGGYAVRDGTGKIKIFKNFKESKALRPDFTPEGIFGGHLLGVKTSKFVNFYSWEGQLVRKIDVVPKQVIWSEGGEFVVVTTETAFFILAYNAAAVNAAFALGKPVPDEGYEQAFEVVHDVSERVRAGKWIGDCFIYTNSQNRLNYCIGGQIVTIAHLDRTLYLLGYVPRDNRVYLVDKNLAVVSYKLHLSVINYQIAILRKNIEQAEQLLPKIPRDQYTRIAQFLEARGFLPQALAVSTEPDHKFDLAVQLGELEVAHAMAQELKQDHRWKQLGELAMSQCRLDLAETCLWNASDIPGLLLLYSSLGNAPGMQKLAGYAREKGENNVAFVCYLLLNRVDDCLELLCSTGRVPEAAFMARTYAPSRVSDIVKRWRQELASINQKAAEALADPFEYENLFPDLQWALKAEELCRKFNSETKPARLYTPMISRYNEGYNIINELKQLASTVTELPTEDAMALFMIPEESSPAPTETNATTVTKTEEELDAEAEALAMAALEAEERQAALTTSPTTSEIETPTTVTASPATTSTPTTETSTPTPTPQPEVPELEPEPEPTDS
ncbi:coatomer subunit beta' [Pelomyxa schiedti]|nr:coatomer subunit beta' [Pelomyxa schiedti]